jgi:hypothetical protein
MQEVTSHIHDTRPELCLPPKTNSPLLKYDGQVAVGRLQRSSIHSYACSLVRNQLSWWGLQSSLHLYVAHVHYGSHYNVRLYQWPPDRHTLTPEEQCGWQNMVAPLHSAAGVAFYSWGLPQSVYCSCCCLPPRTNPPFTGASAAAPCVERPHRPACIWLQGRQQLLLHHLLLLLLLLYMLPDS